MVEAAYNFSRNPTNPFAARIGVVVKRGLARVGEPHKASEMTLVGEHASFQLFTALKLQMIPGRLSSGKALFLIANACSIRIRDIKINAGRKGLQLD